MKKNLCVLGVTLFLSSCATSRIALEPIPCNKFNDCKESIKKLYMLQKPNKAPSEIIVTDEYISYSKPTDIYHNVTGATTTHLLQNTIYFKNIENLRVENKKHTSKYVILFSNKVNRTKQVIIIYDKDEVTKGYSAIKCMVDIAKSNTNSNDNY